MTVIAEVVPGQEAGLRRRLEELGNDPGQNNSVPFARLPTVHFARFFVLDAAELEGRRLAPRLVFFADVDGPEDVFLRELVRVAGAGLDDVFGACVGYANQPDKLRFLGERRIKPTAKYVNTIGRTVQQIKEEAVLRDAIQDFVDRSVPAWSTKTPSDIRRAIQDYVSREPRLAFARHPASPPDPIYVAREWVRFAAVVALVVIFSPLLLLGLPVFLVILRAHEKSDRPNDRQASDEHRAALAAQEDHGVQNPFTSGGPLKAGAFRRLTGGVVLTGTDFLTRHVFNHANLLGVKTIHFGRWVFIDDKRRVLFATSYDGSLENYMDDFIDKIAWGLNIQFSNGLDYPETNWLVLDGARNEQVFKRFNLTHQLVAPFWYAAYQGLTALNIDNNAQIRAGLYGSMSEAATRAWLRRL